MGRKATSFKIFVILSVIIPYSVFAFTVSLDSCFQRIDGSKHFDIYYTLEGIHDCIKITVFPITTAARETLLCGTFIEPSDTGTICEDGSYHIIWDVGADVPGKEFFGNNHYQNGNLHSFDSYSFYQNTRV